MTRRNQKGFVLVVVLWVLAILTVVVLGFGRRAMLEARASVFSLDHMKALNMARGAVARGVVQLRNKAVMDALSEKEGRTSLAQDWARPMDLLHSSEYYTSDDPADMENDACVYQIRDENGLISLNAAPDEILAEVEGMSRTIIRKINARRTGDRQNNTPPEPFQTIEEIRFMPGISDDEWFGDGRNAGLKDVLTCWGDGKININTAPPEVLECIPNVRESVVDAIIGHRAGPDGEVGTGDDGDFATIESIGDLIRVGPDVLEELNRFCTTQSQCFTITGIATRRQGKIVAACVATVYVMPPNASVMKWREEFLDS